jgi:nucleoid-associated protein YgaU
MGQLERYGLYVLCLVIFLILGVAVWGDDPVPAYAGQTAQTPAVESSTTGTAPSTEPVVHALDPVDRLRQELLSATHGTPSRPAAEELEGTKSVEEAADGKGSPAKPAPVEASEAKPTLYTVRDGELLETIAKNKLGKRSRWPEIVAANPGLDPRKVRGGLVIKLPAASQAAPENDAAKPAAAPKTSGDPPAAVAQDTYRVEDGDMLEAIAQRKLGKRSRWPEIVAANPGLDPKKLRAGTVIKLPASGRQR